MNRVFLFAACIFLPVLNYAQQFRSDVEEIEKDTLFSGLEAIPVRTESKQGARKNNTAVSVGLRIGAGKSQMSTPSGDVIRVTSSGLPLIINNEIARDRLVTNSSFTSSYQAAVFARFTRRAFYLQPELLYASKGGKFDLVDKNGVLINRVDAKISTIDVPLLLGIRIRNLRIFGGPQVSFALDKNQAFTTALDPYTTPDFDKNFFKRPVYNAAFGLGYEFKSVFFDLRYENGIGKYADKNIGPANSPKRFSFTTDQFIFSIGIKK